MAWDLETGAHRLIDAVRDFVACDDPGAASRHRRLRDEARAQNTTTHALRARLLDRQLELAARNRELQIDVLLMCATETELTQLELAARKRSLTWEPTMGAVGRYFKLGRVGNDRVSVFRLGAIGSNRADGSAFTCHRARAETGAASVIGVGTAFGIAGSQEVGDVIVSKSIFLYEECTVRETSSASGVRRLYPPDAKIMASEPWVDRFYALRRAGWMTPSGRAGMHVGTLLAGSKRIESATYRDELVARVPHSDDPVVGGEMEAAGIAAACREPAQWVIVKGISDFGTTESRKEIKTTRVLAARAAAECVLDVLEGTSPQ